MMASSRPLPVACGQALWSWECEFTTTPGPSISKGKSQVSEPLWIPRREGPALLCTASLAPQVLHTFSFQATVDRVLGPQGEHAKAQGFKIGAFASRAELHTSLQGMP